MTIRSNAAYTAIALVCFGTTPSAAQVLGCGAPATVTVAAGAAQNDRIDQSVSPAQFEGRGADVSVSGNLSAANLCIVAQVRGGARSLEATQGSLGHERLIDADGGVALLRVVKSTARGAALFLGAELRGSIASTDHAYADLHQSVAAFRLGSASLGPAIRTIVPLGEGIASAQLSSPLVAVVDHSYDAIWSGDTGPNLHVASPRVFRGANADVSYAFPVRRNVSVSASYQASMVRYDDARPVRALRQELLAGAAIRLSRVAR